MTDKFTLYELNEYIRQVMALNFPGELWVSCELGQVSQSRGHFWLDLTEKDKLTDTISAKATAVLWRKEYLRLLEELGTGLDTLLQDGMQVLLKVKIDFHEAYGLKLIVKEIDPSYTLGQLEIKRQQTILELRKAGLFDKNKEIPLPSVLQRVAIISSETAAGLADFQSQLLRNQYAYRFSLDLFPAAMQGAATEKEIRSQLKRIEKRKDRFDCVVLIRGGGARLDLSAFDALDLCKSLAEFPLPVLTGIGHQTDETVADMVANRSLKTPTAVAEFIINRNAVFETQIHELGLYLQQRVQRILQKEELILQQAEQTLKFASRGIFQKQKQELNSIENSIPTAVKFRLFAAEQQLKSIEKAVYLLSPEAAFKRGFSLSSKDGKVIRSVKDVKAGDTILTHLADGAVKSQVEE